MSVTCDCGIPSPEDGLMFLTCHDYGRVLVSKRGVAGSSLIRVTALCP